MTSFKFSQHISYVADKCAKLIFSLSKSAKIHWGLKHETLTTIYNGAILPLLLYGAPVWIEALKYEFNRRKYNRVQRLMNLLIAKAYRTTSREALCILARPHRSQSKLRKQPGATTSGKDTDRTHKTSTVNSKSTDGRTLLNLKTL